MVPIWWLYHLPAVLLWGYGFVGGLPAFTVAITGFILFVGGLTDRSRAIWPSVLAHGAWNGIVAKAYLASLTGAASADCTGSVCPAPFDYTEGLFTGSQIWLGEFGWIAALTMLALGVIAGWWHVRHPLPSEEMPAREVVAPSWPRRSEDERCRSPQGNAKRPPTPRIRRSGAFPLAPPVGLEPTTLRLTAECSAS
jgi:hypothetical protein